MALAQIDSGLKSFEASYAERLHRWQGMAIEKIRERVAAMGTGAQILGSGALSEMSKAELANDLMNIRVRIANFGRGQINEELKKQGVS